METRTRNALLALAGYVGLTAFWFLPVLPQVGSALIGPAEDNMLLYWNLWWGNAAARTPGLELFHTSHLFHPGGHDLWLHSMSWTNVLLSIPLHQALPLPLVYNLLMLSSFVFGGLGAFLLARRFLDRDSLCFFAGFVFAFNPFHYSHALHHLDVSSIQYLPFTVLFYLRTRDDPRLRNIIPGALFFAAASLASFYYLPQVVLVFMADVVYQSVRRRRLDWPSLRAALLVGGLTALLLSPLLVMMAREFFSGADLQTLGPDPTNWFVADLARFVLPNTYSPFWGEPESLSTPPFTGNSWENAVFLGWVNLAALGVLFFGRIRENAWLLVMFGLFIVLSLGQQLHVMGHLVGPALLPYRLLDQIPVLNLGRVPSRMVVMAHLFLGILAARGIDAMLRGTPRWKSWLDVGRRRAWIWATVVVLAGIEFMGIANVNTRVHLPAVYQQIPDEEGVALLNLPLDSYKFDALYMMYQTQHGIPMGGGRVSRVADHGVRGALAEAAPDEAPQILREYGIRYLVVHRAFYEMPPEALFDQMFRRLWQDEHHVLYQVE